MRTTSAKVKSIIEFDPFIKDLTPFIEAANEIVTEVCSTDSAGNAYSDARLEVIERWLAAHFLAVRDPRYQSENMGGAGAGYALQVGMNLSLTPYGQQAMLLDTGGHLAWLDKHISQGKRSKVGITYLGTEPSRLRSNYPWRFYTLPGA